MPTATEHDKAKINDFFLSVAPWEKAYVNAALSYIAIKANGVATIIHGRIILHTSNPINTPAERYETDRIIAGYSSIASSLDELREFVMQIMDGGAIKVPAGELHFVPESGGRISTFFNALHSEGVSADGRLSYLKLSGASRHPYMQQPEIDWELKAAKQPFDSFQELMAEYLLLGPSVGDSTSIEIIAPRVVEIFTNSRVEGAEAEPSVFLAKGLDPKKCRIGFRIFLQGKVLSRGSLEGDVLEWSEQDAAQLGVGKLKIPAGAALHCVASYDGHAHHQYWLADPKNFPNSRRALLEECDGELAVLRDFLFEEKKGRKDARDFEVGVAWLLWMMGFSAAHTGATARTSDGVDLIATTTAGNVVVVECTTGVLKAQSKLPNLIARTEVIKRRMQISHNHLAVLPVIVTALTRDEVRSEIKDAHEHGVAVVTKEDLTEALSQSIVITESEAIFRRLLSSIVSPDSLVQF